MNIAKTITDKKHFVSELFTKYLWTDFFKTTSKPHSELYEMYNLLSKTKIGINTRTSRLSIDSEMFDISLDMNESQSNMFIFNLLHEYVYGDRSRTDLLRFQFEIHKSRIMVNKELDKIKNLKVDAINKVCPYKVGDKVRIDVERSSGGFMEKKSIEVIQVEVYISDIIYKEKHQSYSNENDYIFLKFNKVKKDGSESQHSYYNYETYSRLDKLNIKLLERDGKKVE